MKSVFIRFLQIHWDAVLAAIAGCLFIYFFTRHSGVGISPDSVAYESTAANIRNHFSFTDFNGLPLVDFPLGYPSFLAVASLLTGCSVLQIAPLLNCILFCGVIILTSVIINGYQKRSALYKICILALIAYSPCLLEVYSMLWSETLFIFLILLFIVVFRSYFRTHSLVSLFFAALIASLAFVTRYAGICLLGTGLFLLFFDSELTTLKKIKHLIIFGVAGSSLAVINLLRNSSASGHMAGVREKALRSIGNNLQQIGANLSDWLPFLNGHETGATIVFVTLFIMGVCILIYRCLQQQFFQSYETIVACFFVVYILFLITVATVSRFEDLSSRLLSPVYIPLLLVGSSWMVSFIQRSVRIKRSVALIIVFILYAGFQYNHYQQNAAAWEGIKDAGIPGYTENPWVQAPAVIFVKNNKDTFAAPVFSNANDAVYFLSGIHALAIPHKEIKTEVDSFLQHPSFTLIWFINGDNPDLVGLDFIKQHKKQVWAKELDGGAVYFFSDSTNIPLHK